MAVMASLLYARADREETMVSDDDEIEKALTQHTPFFTLALLLPLVKGRLERRLSPSS